MEEQKLSISFGDQITEQVLHRDYNSVCVTPHQMHSLRFRVAIPREWKEVKIIESESLEIDQLSLLAAFAPSDEISIQVSGTFLPWEVNLIDWLTFQTHRRGIQLKNVESTEGEYGQIVHAIGQSADSEFLRLLVVGNGSHVVLLAGRSSIDASSTIKEVLGLAAASFQFIEVSKQKTRELLSSYVDHNGLFQLLFPSSWSMDVLDSLLPKKSGVDFRLTDGVDTIAYLRIEADKRQPRNAEGIRNIYELTMEELEESGVDVLNLDPIPQGAIADGGERWLGECALPSGHQGQVALFFRPTSIAWLVAVLVSPEKTVNPYAWMRAKRFYEIAFATLRGD